MTVSATSGGGSATLSESELAEYEQEKPARRFRPALDRVISLWCAVISVGVLLQVFFPLPAGTQFYLVIFLAAVLPITLLCYRGWKVPAFLNPFSARSEARSHDDPGLSDWLLALLALAVCLYPLIDFDGFLERRQSPTTLDVLTGALLLVLLLEACRRTTGWVLPLVSVLFIAYAYYGGYLPYTWSLAHQGFNFSAIIGQFTMGTAGFYGTPLNVAASYIVLFTIYGAVLDHSGAGKFFIDLSFAAFKRSRTAPGRTVTLAGFLLGSVSGSGTATAVSLGTVSWPILRRAGYPPEPAGGMLAAAGIGAILSPPTLGAAAFIIAEFLQVSYLTVLGYAVIPTILYYLGILLAIEMDARRHGTTEGEPSTQSAWKLLKRFSYHFLSLFVIIAFMAVDVPPFKAVVYAVVIQFALSFLDKEHRLTAGPLFKALAQGTRSVLPVVATCATAGVIVAVTTQTGLGLNLAAIIVDAAKGLTDNHTVVLILTVVLSAFAVLVLGLAVPVTASFIIAAVIIAPALVQLGVTQPEAYMFIFYYAVLSEVSPPTALAAVATSAITGGKVMPTMWQAWKYTLPAFLVPFAFVLTDNGARLLGQGSLIGMVWTLAVSMLAVAALAVVTGGWIVIATGWVERLLCVPAALLLLYLAPVTIAAGIGLLVIAVLVNLVRRHRLTGPTEGPATS
ncbi:TRAP transporter fused permease subunit [Streptomyces sp. SID13031]|uniref:TRAP transporter permease n=1 Tax=Streptomyces sp. SID13031 TaxID=2706046 RepID=UPI0013C68651|nr:TRAP transporter fused permease subunit [Streptomyces sp. SID13031]NEA31936.1 TRAP transporter fused permease subunit [Streptomyces sp. SID13031]